MALASRRDRILSCRTTCTEPRLRGAFFSSHTRDQTLSVNLLAIETATNVCSVAVAQSGRLRAEISLSRPRAHAEHLVPMIQDALRYADVRADQLQVVAVSSGPGSYTGLRIGVSTAKGLAEAVEAALVGVPTLMGLAAQIQTVPGEYVAAA